MSILSDILLLLSDFTNFSKTIMGEGGPQGKRGCIFLTEKGEKSGVLKKEIFGSNKIVELTSD